LKIQFSSCSKFLKRLYLKHLQSDKSSKPSFSISTLLKFEFEDSGFQISLPGGSANATGSVPLVGAAECALMQDGEPRTAAAKMEAGQGVGEPPHHASVVQGRADKDAGRHARDDELAACKAELAASVNAHAALQHTLATYCAEIEEVACSLAHVRRG
jgi:hypothetical protein